MNRNPILRSSTQVFDLEKKLYEELITTGEGIVPTTHEKIIVLHGGGKSCREMKSLLSELAIKANTRDARGIKEVLKILMPEYIPDLEAKSVIGSYIAARESRN